MSNWWMLVVGVAWIIGLMRARHLWRMHKLTKQKDVILDLLEWGGGLPADADSRPRCHICRTLLVDGGHTEWCDFSELRRWQRRAERWI